ncbi:MAG: peptidylprolyl isomerase [Halanaerobiales bacterium]
MLKRSILVMVLIALVFSMPVMAQEDLEEEQNKVAAVVNGDEINIEEVDEYANLQQIFMTLYQTDQEFTQLFLQSEEGEEILNQFRERKLDGLIEQELLKQEAENRDISLDEEKKEEIFQNQLENIKQQNNMSEEELLEALSQQGIESLEDYKEQFLSRNEDNLLINALREEVLSDIEVSDEEAEEYYEENKDQYEHDEQVEASHILLEDEEKAEELISELDEGASFGEMAKEHSTGPSAENEGELGYFSRGDMVPDFEDAAFELDVGEITEEPVETEHGFHIIKVTDKRDAGTTSFEDAKEDIKQQIQGERQQDEWEQFVENLKEDAEIEKKL